MYKHILVAVDFTEQGEHVVNQAISLHTLNKSRLSLVHVVESVNQSYGDNALTGEEIEYKIRQESEQKLGSIVEKYTLKDVFCIALNGRAADQIHRYADENQVDLIVTGSHGKHGLQLLLGSTANAVLHGANCDVLAVRIKD